MQEKAEQNAKTRREKQAMESKEDEKLAELSAESFILDFEMDMQRRQTDVRRKSRIIEYEEIKSGGENDMMVISEEEEVKEEIDEEEKMESSSCSSHYSSDLDGEDEKVVKQKHENKNVNVFL